MKMKEVNVKIKVPDGSYCGWSEEAYEGIECITVYHWCHYLLDSILCTAFRTKKDLARRLNCNDDYLPYKCKQCRDACQESNT